MPDPELLTDRLAAHGDRLAVVDPDGRHTYAELVHGGAALAARLRDDRRDLDGARVATLCRPGADQLTALLGAWWAGGLAVPLHPGHPVAELGRSVDDAGADLLVTSAEHRAAADALAAARPGLVVVELGPAGPGSGRGGREGWGPVADPVVPALDPDRPALMVFTSGTTGRPKGAVHTHAGLAAQIRGMVAAWGWCADDRALLVLPLHHVHGLVNVSLCPLWVGAACEAPGGFEAGPTWERLAGGEVTVFMAVPTVYARLVAAWEGADEATRRRWSAGAAGLRLMVSGSAALPVATLDRWEAITGHRLLERYGMTELGMVLSNRLDERVPGHVGHPFPGVEVRVVGDDGVDVEPGRPGELLVRGPQVFAGYWERPDATAEAFVDGWFRTGDVGVATPEGFRLLGRASVDILKTGGEKVSALEVEEAFRQHPGVADCAVVGLPDDEWGQRVAIAVVPAAGAAPDPDALRAWGKERLAAAKVPTRWLVVDELPRNAMGKVVKAAVAERFAG